MPGAVDDDHIHIVEVRLAGAKSKEEIEKFNADLKDLVEKRYKGRVELKRRQRKSQMFNDIPGKDAKG
jgi:hypothetical protein